MNNFQYIKDALEQENKSISWLAKEVGVSKGYLSKLLNNKVSEPGSSKIRAIHKALNLDIDLVVESEKQAYLIDIDKISIEKYLDIAKKSLKNNLDIYIVINSKLIHKKINVRRFYDYLSFSQGVIHIVSEHDLKKSLSKVNYDHIFEYNNEFAYLKNEEIVNINIEENSVLDLGDIKNKAVLILSNDPNKLSILLNVLKLKSTYTIKDYHIYREVDYHSNIMIRNQLEMVEDVYKACQDSRVLVVGNEYLSLNSAGDIDTLKRNLINYKEYLDLFDEIININFYVEEEKEAINQKLVKALKRKVVTYDEDDILLISEKIMKTVEAMNYEN